MATKKSKSIKKKKIQTNPNYFDKLMESLVKEWLKASQDALVYGEGRLKSNPDGSITHIPRNRKN